MSGPLAPAPAQRDVRLAIVGAGFAGIGLAIRLRQRGIGDFVLLERAGDLGGTWRDNTYPGCACDVQSHLYSLSFAPNAEWSRRFSAQDEIWQYLQRITEAHGVRPHLRFGEEVHGARWDARTCRWEIATATGTWRASMLVLANGPLSDPVIPSIPGLEGFAGTVFHSARWRHDVDVRGTNVAVVGTGASAVQFIPRLQPQVAHLTVYQRTPPWIMPRRDRAIPAWRSALYRNVPAARLAVRGALWATRELIGLPFRHPQLTRVVEYAAQRHMRAQIPDPALRAKLLPDYRIGCKRILISDDYYPALAAPNVEVIAAGVAAVEGKTIVDAHGGRREVDTLVFATGFRATDPALAPAIRGVADTTLADAWQGTPRAYLGTTVTGFPNLFILLGPNTGLGHTSILLMIEAQIAHLLGVLDLLARSGAPAIEPHRAAQDAFVREMDTRLAGTVWNDGGCRSWYLDRNGVNSAIWPGGTWSFQRRLSRVRADDYRVVRPA